MGLDSVELVMDIEDRFNIRLSDEECGRLYTVSDLAAAVISRLPRATAVCPTARAFFSVRRTLVEQWGIERCTIRPDTLLEEVFPRRGRRGRWGRFEKAGPKLPRLSPTDAGRRWLSAISDLLLILWACTLVGLVVGLGVYGVGVALVTLVAGTVAWCHAMDLWHTQFPAGFRTLGDLARAIAPPTLPNGGGDRLIAELAILQEVQAMTANQCGLPPERVRPESRFIDDLGMC